MVSVTTGKNCCIISIGNNVTKKTAEFDLNYVYNLCIFTFRYFKISRFSKKKITLILRWVGVEVNWLGQLASPPTRATKHMKRWVKETAELT